MDVSIIIVNYNTCEMTANCIDSIFEKTKGIEFEVILVDNNSSDNSYPKFSKDSRIIYLYNKKNLGFGVANNIGMERATGKYIFLLNSDTIVVNNAIKIFYDYAECMAKPAFLGCWLEDYHGNYIKSCGDIDDVRSIIWNIFKSYIPGRHEGDNTINYMPEKEYKVGFVSGADMFFPRQVFEKTLGFDSHFFMYFEETDWQRRASRLGIYSYVIHGPRIIHLEGGSQKKADNRGLDLGKFERFTTSRNYYIKKDNPWIIYLFYRVIMVVFYTPKLLVGKSANVSTSVKAIKILLKRKC